MRTKELIRMLKDNGITLVRSGNNHDIYYSKITNKKFAVPRHPAEIPTGTLNILKDAGLK